MSPNETKLYNSFVRDMMDVADAFNRTATLREGTVAREGAGLRGVDRAYDYARAGGSRLMRSPADAAPAEAVPARLPIDAWTTDDAYQVRAYLPGVAPENLEITFEQDELTIRGQFAPREEGADFLKRELFHGAFERRITFNKPVNGDAIEATHENGVLTLRVPKAETVKPRQIKVQAK